MMVYTRYGVDHRLLICTPGEVRGDREGGRATELGQLCAEVIRR